MNKAIVISALGRKTFTAKQVLILKKSLRVRFFSCLTPMNPFDFIKLVRPYPIIGLTRRSLRNLDRNILEKLVNLKGLAIYATGYEWIDLEYLVEKKIAVSYLPDYSTLSAAEHALGSLLTLTRRIHLSFDKTRGLVTRDVSLRGQELFGKTVGIVGFGRIGRRLAELLKPFQVRFIYNDIKTIASSFGTQSSLKSLLRQSNVVFLCCPLNRGQKPLLGKEEINQIKRGGLIINISRPGLVDHDYLLRALRKKTVSGYALDEQLDILTNARNVEAGRILQTGHTAWYSTEVIERGTQGWVENLEALGAGKKRNRI